MASRRREQAIGRLFDDEEKEDDLVGDDSGDDGEEVMEVRRRVSRFAVDGDSGAGGASEVARRRVSRFAAEEGSGVQDRRRGGVGEGVRALPPPHAWLAVEETRSKKGAGGGFGSENEEQWARLLQRGGSAQGEAEEARQQQQPRRSSFSVVRRERGAREAWLDRAWEMKRSWHQRNGGAPDADTPVVVVVGTKQQQVQGHGGSGSGTSSPSSCSSPHRHGHAAGGGVAMDMEEVRACRDLGLDLPSDCTVKIQCYGISTAGSSPTHSSHAGSGSGSESPSTPGSCSLSSPSAGEDPVDVKARLKVWAQAVALASTTQLGS